MDKFGEIEVRITGSKGNIPLSPDNYDIAGVVAILQGMEDLLYPTSKKDRPIISYNIEEGSVKNVFKTSIQAVIGFSAVLGQIETSRAIDFLELRTAIAIENIQNLSFQKDYTFEIRTSVSEHDASELTISPDSNFVRTENIWVEAEIYFYGVLTNAGGKNKANIHLDTEEFGSLTIDTPKQFLKGQKENMLYRRFGIRAKGMQNIETGEVDKRSLSLVQLVDHSPKYDDAYLNQLINKAKGNWKGIDADKWLSNLRGGYDV